MLKTLLLFTVFYISILQTNAQMGVNWMNLEGKVVNKNPETPLEITLILEYLPYGKDKMIFQSDVELGEYSLNIENKKKYKFNVKAKGYIEIIQKIDIQNDLQPFLLEVIPNGGGTILSLDLNFNQGKVKLMQDSFLELDKLVSMLSDHSGMAIQLEGDTDFRGSASSNLRLNETRIQSVKKYQANSNISSKRIKTKAYGGSDPLSKKNIEEAKLMNRRV